MDEKTIADMTSLEMVKLKRAQRRGKLTRLTKKVSRPLQDQSANTLTKLKDDFRKDKKLHDSFQVRYEQLLEGEVAPELLAKELENSEELNETYEILSTW